MLCLDRESVGLLLVAPALRVDAEHSLGSVSRASARRRTRPSVPHRRCLQGRFRHRNRACKDQFNRIISRDVTISIFVRLIGSKLL